MKTVRAHPELVAALAAQGYSQATTADMLGVSRQRISQIANRDGIEFLPGGKDYDLRDTLRDMHARGLTVPQMAKETGRRREVIRWVLRDMGLEPHKPATKAARLRELLAAGLTLSEAARELGWPVKDAWTTANRLGITEYARKRGPYRTLEDYRRCAEAGMTAQEAARHLGVSVRAAYGIAWRHGFRFARAQR